MLTRLRTATLFVLYQLSLLAGILLLPVAVAVRQAGFRLPVDRVVRMLGRAYERRASGSEAS